MFEASGNVHFCGVIKEVRELAAFVEAVTSFVLALCHLFVSGSVDITGGLPEDVLATIAAILRIERVFGGFAVSSAGIGAIPLCPIIISFCDLL